jgi:beta-glucosidase
MEGQTMSFNSDFIWGTASSAYQVEGAFARDGKGNSIWDVFANTPGAIKHNENGNLACCHYDHYQEDIALMQQLGIKAYRFSISWPRVFPLGDMVVNPLGLQFYDNLVDCCLSHGITPYITLYHWDLPQALEDTGGWLNRDTAYAFALYSAFICKHFSDRVRHFITINEPQIISFLGYYNGDHAPGRKLSINDTLCVVHHLALAHGLAVSAMRESTAQPVQIGFSSTGALCYPADDTSTTDINMARRLTFEITKDNWNFCHHIFCDAACLGHYPDIAGTFLEKETSFDFVKYGDMSLICQPIDFLGLNIYNGHAANSDGILPASQGSPRTALKWPVSPRVMNYGVRFLYERYQLPILITENGLSCNDKIYLDGKVHDADRIDFLTRYLTELEKAYDSGVDIQGYFHWSFTDNFEWNNGYDERFGLVYIDYATQQRIPKDSALWYQSFINQHLC